MIADYFKYVTQGIKQRKLRAWLTMLGVIVGIAAVVSLVSLGQGLQNAVGEQFELLGTDKIFVAPGESLMGAFGAPAGIELTDDDLDVIKGVNGVEFAGGFISKIGEIKFRDEIKYTFANGMPADESIMEIFSSFQGFEIIRGRNLKPSDKYKALVGIMHYEGDVFDKEVDLRDTLIIEGQEFKVVGVIGRIGNPSDDSQVYIPLETSREVFDEPTAYTVLLVQTKKGIDVSKVAEDIEKALRKSRDVEEGEEDFAIQTSEQLVEVYGSVLGIVTAVLIGIAAISLLVGGIGIMNTMYTAVLQRTSEIGVMKAIGARNSDILTLFLIESGLYGMLGGGIGILIGMAIAYVVVLVGQQYVGEALLKADFSLLIIGGSLAFSFFVGVLSGVAPAYRASKLKPVDALRYE
ncbi:ABC transporter permease [Nanoarchaeota archaeon]